MSHTAFSALPAIYDAALSDEHWPQALTQFSREIGAVGAILIAIDQVGLPFHVQQSSYDPELVNHYFQNYGEYDQQVNSQHLAVMPPLQLSRDCDIWGDITLIEDLSLIHI